MNLWRRKFILNNDVWLCMTEKYGFGLSEWLDFIRNWHDTCGSSGRLGLIHLLALPSLASARRISGFRLCYTCSLPFLIVDNTRLAVRGGDFYTRADVIDDTLLCLPADRNLLFSCRLICVLQRCFMSDFQHDQIRVCMMKSASSKGPRSRFHHYLRILQLPNAT